jgi:lycopene cyclase domain-containing protein
MHYLYAALLLGSIAGPLALSFTKKVAYYKSWFALFPAILIAAFPFIIWDILFSKMGIWGFHLHYCLGITFCGLPLEELLFFLVIPFCCMFIYANIRAHYPQIKSGKTTRLITIILALFCSAMALLHINQWYTLTAFGAAAVLLIYHAFRAEEYMASFHISFAISMIPFLIINGVLTGTLLTSPVVWYNDHENLGIRMLTIPVEDVFYGMAMLLLGNTLYEFLLQKRVKNMAA